MKKLHLIMLVLGFAFLGYLLWTTGVTELGRQLATLGWGLIPLILIEGLADIFHAVGWRHCLTGPHRSLSLLRIFRIRMVGFALNYLTPTASVGGEVAKAALLASSHVGPGAVTAVLIGKFCFAFAHVLFVMAGTVVVLWHIPLPRGLWLAVLLSSLVMSGGMGVFLWIQKHGKLGGLVRWLVARKVGGRLLQKAAHGITDVDEALKIFFRERPRDLLHALFWHMIGYSMGILQTWYFFSLLVEQPPIIGAAGVWVLGLWFDLVTFAVPVNIGILEWSRIVALKAVGGTAVTGMTYGVAIRLAQLFWAGFGLINYALLAAPERAATRAAVAEGREACIKEP